MRTVLKLGGSVLTEKTEPETIDEAALEATSDAIAASEPEDLVVVHGGGSFGHPHAEAHGVSTRTGSHDATAIYAIHEAMCRFNAVVVEALQERNVPALPVHPLSLAYRDSDGTTTIPADGVEAFLDAGIVPVLHGDVVVQAGAGATILSGDEIVVSLTESLRAERLGVCAGVPGVLDDDGAVIERIDDYGSVADVLGDSTATDVTGGMAGKVDALLDVSTPATIFGLADLPAFLAGEDPGTLVASPGKPP